MADVLSTGAGGVPVVPCDDAAIERVAKTLAARREPDRHDVVADEYDYEDARAALRAAGEIVIHETPPWDAVAIELARDLQQVDPDFPAMTPKQRDRYSSDVRRLATAVLGDFDGGGTP